MKGNEIKMKREGPKKLITCIGIIASDGFHSQFVNHKFIKKKKKRIQIKTYKYFFKHDTFLQL